MNNLTLKLNLQVYLKTERKHHLKHKHSNSVLPFKAVKEQIHLLVLNLAKEIASLLSTLDFLSSKENKLLNFTDHDIFPNLLL